MNTSSSDIRHEFERSTSLMNPCDSALIVVDVQEKLLPHVSESDKVVWNIQRLIRGAHELNVAVYVTEQYPAGLGPTVAAVTQATKPPSTAHEKTMFSCRGCEQLLETLESNQIRNVVLVGIETHVCVLQSAFDFIAYGFDVHVCVDAVGSRFRVDRDTAMRRMESAGITLVSTEMALFEWCTTATNPAFKAISRIVREAYPSAP